MKDNKGYCPQLIIPDSFEECFTYAQQMLWLYQKIKDLQAEVDNLKEQLTSKP